MPCSTPAQHRRSPSPAAHPSTCCACFLPLALARNPLSCPHLLLPSAAVSFITPTRRRRQMRQGRAGQVRVGKKLPDKS